MATTKRPTTKSQRARIYARYGLQRRTDAETKAYQAMLKQQAEDFLHRRAQIAAAYGAQAERERLDGPELMNYPTRPHRLPYSPGSLEQQIALRTDALYSGDPQRLDDSLDVEEPKPPTRSGQWWSLLWPRSR